MINYGSRPIYNPKQLFAIGDIHGEADKLLSLLTKIEPLMTSETHIVFCGDLINRGPKSPQVLEIINDLRKKYPGQVFVIMGNHEWMLLHYLHYGTTEWTRQYAGKTIAQMSNLWGLEDTEPPTIAEALEIRGILEWFGNLIPYYETEEVLITHAPLDKTQCFMSGLMDYEEHMNDPEESPKRFFLDRPPLNNDIRWQFTDENIIMPEIKKFRICGHQFSHHKMPRIFKNRAFIDTGCGCKENHPLSAIQYPGKKVFQS